MDSFIVGTGSGESLKLIFNLLKLTFSVVKSYLKVSRIYLNVHEQASKGKVRTVPLRDEETKTITSFFLKTKL